MKRLLLVLLSLSLLCNLAQISEAKTNYINNNEAVICKSKDGERVWIRGENLPPININNKNKAIANSSSKSKSNSKYSSTSDGGGSSIAGQIAKGFVFLGGSAFVLKSLFGVSIFSLFGGAIAGWKAHNLKTTVDGYISSAKDGLKNFFYGNQTVPDQPTGQKGNQGNSESGTDQPTGQSGSKGDLESETDQPTGQNGGQDSQTSTEAEGSARFNWENFSLTRALLGLDYYIRLASSKLGGPSIDQANPLYQTIFI